MVGTGGLGYGDFITEVKMRCEERVGWPFLNMVFKSKGGSTAVLIQRSEASWPFPLNLC